MSVDYYLVSVEKKVCMPIFTMSMGSCWQPDKRYLFDFILAAGHDIRLVHEDADDIRPSHDEPGWTYIDSRVPYIETDRSRG